MVTLEDQVTGDTQCGLALIYAAKSIGAPLGNALNIKPFVQALKDNWIFTLWQVESLSEKRLTEMGLPLGLAKALKELAKNTTLTKSGLHSEVSIPRPMKASMTTPCISPGGVTIAGKKRKFFDENEICNANLSKVSGRLQASVMKSSRLCTYPQVCPNTLYTGTATNTFITLSPTAKQEEYLTPAQHTTTKREPSSTNENSNTLRNQNFASPSQSKHAHFRSNAFLQRAMRDFIKQDAASHVNRASHIPGPMLKQQSPQLKKTHRASQSLYQGQPSHGVVSGMEPLEVLSSAASATGSEDCSHQGGSDGMDLLSTLAVQVLGRSKEPFRTSSRLSPLSLLPTPSPVAVGRG